MTAAEVLSAAAARLEQHGWRQGNYGDTRREEPACAVGAVYAVGRKFPEIGEALDMLATSIGVRPDEIPEWNDKPERTLEEVTAAMRRAASKETK